MAMRLFVSRVDKSFIHWLAIFSAWAALLLVFAFIFIYASVAIPFADDYGRATAASLEEAYKRVIADYFNWTGRWASMGIQYMIWAILAGDTQYFFIGYRIVILVFLICSFIGWYLIVRLLTNLSKWNSLAIAVASGGTYLSVFHSPGETLFWLPGATEGGLSSLLAALVLWGSVPLFSQSCAQVSASKVFILSLGIFFSAGCHELGGMFLATFFSLALISSFLFGKGWTLKILIYLLIASTIATALSVFAPGNSVRAAAEGMQTGSVLNAVNGFSQIFLRTLRTILSPSIVFGTAILLILVKSQPNSFFRVHKSESLLFVFVVPLALAAVAVVVAWKTATTPAGRTVNFFVAILVYIWIPALVIWVSHLSSIKFSAIPAHIPVWLLGVFALSVLSGPTVDRAFFSYKTHLPAWIQYQNNKHSILSSAGSSEIVFVKEAPPAPPMFFTQTDITTDSESWINKIQGKYYDVSGIVLENKY